MASLARVQTRLRSQRNLIVVVGAFFFAGFETSIINVVWQPFVLSLGTSMSVLGLLTSLGGFNGIIPTLVSPVGGWFADRRGRKLLLLGASLSCILGYVLYTTAGLTGLAFALAPGIILVGAAQIARPATNALVGESVRAERHGSAYSLLMFANIVPGILAPLAAGWLADRTGYTAIFPLALGAEALSFLLIARFLQETGVERERAGDWNELAQFLRRAWRPPRGLGALFIISAMDSFSWGLGWGLLYGLFNKEYGLDAGHLGILSSSMSLSWAVLQLPIGRVIDRIGPKAILALSEALGPPLMLVWMTQSRFEILAASMALFAATAALWIPARSTFITQAVAPESRAEAFGRLTAFGGLLAFPAPFVGGFLYDHFGFTAPLLANLIGSFITLVVIVIFVHEPHGSSHLHTSIFISKEDRYAKS
jgi:MFS transporter, DHA1 family, multidrug resistance protein